ncbi:hypothetical protein EMIT0P201_11720 [Pseudomonas chlororaphis]
MQIAAWRPHQRHRGQASLLQKMRNLLPHSTRLPVTAAEGCDKAAGLQRPQDPAPPFGVDRSLAGSAAATGSDSAPGRPVGRRLALALAFDLNAPLTTMAERRH